MGHHLVKKGFLIPNFKAKMSPTNKVLQKKTCTVGFFFYETESEIWECSGRSIRLEIQSQIYTIKYLFCLFIHIFLWALLSIAHSRKYEAVRKPPNYLLT